MLGESVSLAAWWPAAERLSFDATGDMGLRGPSSILARALGLELGLQVQGGPPAAPLGRAPGRGVARVQRLIGLRLDVREARDEPALRRLAAEVEGLSSRRVPGAERPDAGARRAPAGHDPRAAGELRGRRGGPRPARSVSSRNAPCPGPGSSTGSARRSPGLGSWVEARRTLGAALQLKGAAGDPPRHRHQLREPGPARALPRGAREARAILLETLERVGSAIGAASRMRLQTHLVEAGLATDDARLEAWARELLALLEAARDALPHLQGYAALAARPHRPAEGGRPRHALVAPACEGGLLLSGAAGLGAVLGGRAPAPISSRTRGGARRRAPLLPGPDATEAELTPSCSSAAGGGERRTSGACARTSTTRSRWPPRPTTGWWLQLVDQAYREHDPRGFSERVVLRFSGRSAEELARTVTERATIVFADLVDFTPRAVEMPPDEVMETVRSVFELAVPLMAAHRRAAAGPVVLGTLGSHYKME